MGDVVKFPGFDERQWLVWETTIIDGLTGEGVPREQAEWTRSEWKRRMVHAVQSIQASVSVPSSPSVRPDAIEFAQAVAKEVEKHFHQIITRLSWELLLAVSELCAAHFNAPPPPEKAKAQILKLITGDKHDADDGKEDA